MNILYLAHRIPYPPNKGDKLRAFRQIEHLARRHRVWCAFFVDDPRDARHVHDLRQWCHGVAAIEIKPLWAKLRGLSAMARGRTLTEGYYEQSEMNSLLAEWKRQTRFDVVFAFSSSMANYALQVAAPRRILDLCDLDSAKWCDYADHITSSMRVRGRDHLLRYLYRIEGLRLASAELRWIDRFDAAILATEAEAAPLRGLVSPRKLHVIGNGVEVSAPLQCKPSAHPIIGFVGVMDYFPNIDAVTWFVRNCWPMVRQQFPKATFRIVGRSPTPAVRRLASMGGVEVAGEVACVADELASFDVSVAPLRIARGVQNKVLEAMAAAKPVVLTSHAAKGIAAVPGRDYLVGDTPEQMAVAVCSLFSNPLLRNKLGDSGRDFVATHRRWETELGKLDALVTESTVHSASRNRLVTLEPGSLRPTQAARQPQPAARDLSAPG